MENCTVRIGNRIYHKGQLELEVDGIRHKLEPKVADLLDYFLANPNLTLSREDIIETVWRGRIVTDDALNRCVSLLRNCLDSESPHKYIKTIRKRGYRFLQADELPDVSTNSFVQNLAESSVVSRKNRWVLTILTIFLIVTVLAILWRTNLTPAHRANYSTLDDPQSIAIMPFENLSGSSEQDYFVNGIHDALITSLSRLSSLKVTSRTSVFRVSEDLLMPEIGKLLGVKNLLEGSVTIEGDRIRVIVQLIKAATDEHIWADSFERKLTDIFSLQNDIARSITDAIAIQLSAEDQIKLDQRVWVDPDTYDSYLKGMFQIHKETYRGYHRGIEIFQDAISNNPQSALAHAGLAYGYAKLGHSPFPSNYYLDAKSHALKALELDPNLAEAHLALAMYKLYYEWNWPAAEKALDRALQLDPNLVYAYYHKAWLYELLDQHEDALAYGEKTVELSPLDPFVNGWLASQYRSAGLLQKAIEQAEYTLELQQNHAVAIMVSGNTYAQMGQMDKAIEIHEHLRDNAGWSFVLASTLAQAGYIENAQAIADTLDTTPDNSFALSLLYAAMIDEEQTLYWLEVARKNRLPWYPWLISWFPQMEPLHEHPRIVEMRERLNLKKL